MTVTRLTPPSPPQVEFQLTVTAEELAVICALTRLVDGGDSTFSGVSDDIYMTIKERNALKLPVADEGIVLVDNVDDLLADAAADIAEAN